ncbi:hypothetical protein SCUP515_00023 [Seiridium cupressi]
MHIKTIKVGRSIIGKIKYADESMSSTSPSSRDCPPRGTTQVNVGRLGTSPRERPRSPPQAGLRPYQAPRPAVNDAVDTWRSRTQPRPRASPSSSYSERSPPRQRTDSQHESPSRPSRESARRGEEGPASRHRGPRSLDIDKIVQDFEDMNTRDPVKDECVPSYEDTDNFFPTPKVTFFIDRPTNLVCSVCQEAPLRMKSSTRPSEDDTVILPCCHAFCRGCLDVWMEAHRSCPLCRLDLERKCGHPLEPRVVAHDTIMSLPPTMAEGGKVAPRCWDCRQHGQAKQLRQSERSFRKCRELLARCKQDLAAGVENGREMVAKAQAAFEKSRKDFEQFSKNVTYENSSHMHTFW